jgi:uncharacterized linocin/CFP29 family protein
MSDKFLHRADAPFTDAVWAKIDETVVGAAKSQLSARRILFTEGPYGLGFKSLPMADKPESAKGGDGAAIYTAGIKPVTLIRCGFTLSARDVAAFEEQGVPLELGGAAVAAIACARQEDSLLLYGLKTANVEGLLTAKGAQTLKLKSWNEVGVAADDLIQAVTKLDTAGFHGPYTLALSPKLYNLALRRYPQTGGSELEHLKQIVGDEVVKAPAIAAGGVLLATGKQFASIVLGQDLATAFVGPAGGDYELMVSESVALRLLQSESVCILQ